MVDAAPGHVGDVQQAVDAAEVDERTVVGDVLDDALDDLAFLEALHELRALLGAGLLEHGAARHDDVAAALVHLEDLEGLRVVHQRGDVADRADVDLAARQEGHGAVEVDGEAALDLVEDDAFDALALVELLFEPDPALFAAGLLARQHRLAERVLDALEIDLDGVADLQRRPRARAPNSLSGTRPSTLRPTSMTAMSFSMATTVPLTTLAFAESSVVKDSSRRAAKSSRVGLVW